MGQKVDYLIIGQGIAGSILALLLQQQNKKVHLIDATLSHSSSMVAAGIMNPLVLKRLTLSWRAQEFIDFNKTFYPSIEKKLKEKFYHPIPLYKLISSKEEEHFWDHRYFTPGIDLFLKRELIDCPKDFYPKKTFKMGKVKQTAWLNTELFLTNYREKLKQEDEISEENFSFQDLKDKEYKDIQFDKIVFCEGINALKNPFLKDLPIIGAKGELVELTSEELNINEIIKKQIFILPLGKKHFKIGASFDRDYTHLEPTEKEKDLLLQQFESLSNANYKVVKHQAGIRPTVIDRKPIMGRIKENYYVFNGLGARGCMMAPLLAKELIDFIEKNSALNRFCRIERFFKKN